MLNLNLFRNDYRDNRDNRDNRDYQRNSSKGKQRDKSQEKVGDRFKDKSKEGIRRDSYPSQSKFQNKPRETPYSSQQIRSPKVDTSIIKDPQFQGKI